MTKRESETKRIVILFDGTGNEIERDRSNILRLHGALQKGPNQLVYYDPGVGTFGGNGWWGQKTKEVFALTSGFGLHVNVKEAYRFLVNNYSDNGGAAGTQNEIYIFGFSRGAYTARVLAGFLHAFGLMQPHNLNLVDYAYDAYKQIGGSRANPNLKPIEMHRRVLAPRRPPIKLLGLFDTVATVIEPPRTLSQWNFRRHAFTSENPSVEYVRHAVAIDEKRVLYTPRLWPNGAAFKPGGGVAEKPQDVKEVWFAGVHSDVGGGYPEKESALAKIPLEWMINETKPMGLAYINATVNKIVLGEGDTKYVAPYPNGEVHNSMKYGWSIVEALPVSWHVDAAGQVIRSWKMPFTARSRTIPEGASIHDSVQQRRSLPKNLPKIFNGA